MIKKYPLLIDKSKADGSQFTEHQKLNVGKYKPDEKLMLKLTTRSDYVNDGEVIDCCLDILLWIFSLDWYFFNTASKMSQITEIQTLIMGEYKPNNKLMSTLTKKDNYIIIVLSDC